MVGSLDLVQRRPGPQSLADPGDEIEPGERVSGALKEQHGHIDLLQVLGSVDTRVSWRVQRKTEKGQTFNTR
jgi:hypothetical protein